MRTIAITTLLVLVGLAGCLSNDDGSSTEEMPNVMTETNDLSQLVEMSTMSMVFEELIVDPAVDRTGDLYEPTMEVCDDGSIYITGHTIAVDTTGAPVYGSHDGGETWEQLPFLQDQHMPGDVQGATPPISDEIFLACGDDGYLYGSDITLATYPVNAWSDHGAIHDYWNFNAYDESKVITQAGECTTVGIVPVAAPAKDRPWSAYSNGTLLLTSNPAGGANQIGVVDVPFADTLDYSLGAVVDGIDWNVCAGTGGSIPGVPDIAKSGLFAAPQRTGNELFLTLGHKDNVMDVENKAVFNFTTFGEITSVYGHAAFDAKDNLFVGITNNSFTMEVNEDDETVRVNHGGMVFATSTDGGETFVERRFHLEGSHLRHFYMDPNDAGPGALVVWAVDGDNGGFDWYFGHLQIGAAGEPYFAHVSLGIDDGPAPSAHVTGASVGPNGESYTAMFTSRAGTVLSPTTPLSVYKQTSGPTLPVF